MRRRQVLAAVPALLAGCSDSDAPPRDRWPTATDATTTPLPETITDCEPTPDPPSEPTADEARAFVAEFEEARIYNELVAQNGGPDECRPDGPGVQANSSRVRGATDVSVESAETAVVSPAPSGYYVVSSCSGAAEYLCVKRGPGTCGSSSRRNAHFVTHYVGDGEHVRIPHNWIVCAVREEPYRADDPSENVAVPEGEAGAEFRVYDFEEGRHEIDVTLTHAGADEEILSETYEPRYGPAVQTNVAVRTGAYRLEVASGGERTVRAFTLYGRDDPSWNGVCVYRAPDGALDATVVATEGELAVPRTRCYERSQRERNDGTEDATDA